MEKINSQKGEFNKQNHRNKKIESEQEIFKEKIKNLLFYGNAEKSERFNLLLKKILLKWRIQKYIWDSDFSFFKNYQDSPEKLEKKLQKYFPIHENIFYKILNEKIERFQNPSGENVKNIILNQFKKYAHILFLFSEKIKLSDLELFLKMDLSNLSYMYSSTKRDIELFDNFETDINERIKQKLNEKWEEIKWETEKIIDEKIFSTMYRQLYREIEEQPNSSKNKWEEIAKKINEIYPKAMKKIFYIFEMWIEWWYKQDEQAFKNLKIIIRKIIESVSFMKKENIAFENFSEKKVNPNFIKDFLKFFLQVDSDYKEEFEILVNAIFEDNIENKKSLYENLNTSLKIKENKKLNSMTPQKLLEKTNLNIEKVDFDYWQEVPELQKYKNVFSKVLWNNWKIKIADFLELKNENSEKYLKIYAEYSTNWNKEETEKLYKVLEKQVKNILSYEWKNLKDFINDDINNLNFLIKWWRFILKIRTLKEESKEINLKNISKIEEKKYWIIEQISEKLISEKILPSEKIIFSIDSKPRNTSVKTIDTLLFDLIKWLKKWFINLNEEKIKLTNNEIKFIWAIQDLYIPSWLTESKIKSSKKISIIDKYLDYWIDTCFAILKQNKDELNNLENYKDSLIKKWIIDRNTKISSKSYKEVLIENKIIKKDSKKIQTKDLNQIQRIVEILKYFKTRINHLEQMLYNAKTDKSIFKENPEIKKFLEKENSDFWPDKSPDRAFIKLIWEYNWNFNKLWDLIRLRIIWKDLNESVEQVINFIKIVIEDKNITNISIDDKIWEPISMPKENSWYRDIKLLLKLSWWSTVEVQFQIEDMYKIKSEWINLEDEENENIFEKMKKEDILFSTQEMIELLKISKERNINLPTIKILTKMYNWQENKINWKNFENLTETKISTDYTYHIIRQLEKWPIRQKLTRLERILADSAWSKIVLKYLKSKEIKVK